MSKRTRIVVALIATQVVLTVPWVVFGGASPDAMSGTALMGALSMLMAVIMGGPRFGAHFLAPLVVFSGLAVWWADIPMLAALVVGVAAFWRGMLSRTGLHGAAMLAVVSVGFLVAQPPAAPATGSLPAAPATAVVVLSGAAWALIVLWLVRSVLPALPRKPVPEKRALWFAVTTAVITGVAASVVSSAQLEHAGGWFIMTVLIVMQPVVRDSLVKSLQRAGGTALGFVLAFAIGSLLDGQDYQTSAASLVGGLAMLAAMYLMLTRKPYWQFATAITLAIVLLEGASTSIVATDIARLLATLAAVIVVMVMMAVFVYVGERQHRADADTASQK